MFRAYAEPPASSICATAGPKLYATAQIPSTVSSNGPRLFPSRRGEIRNSESNSLAMYLIPSLICCLANLFLRPPGDCPAARFTSLVCKRYTPCRSRLHREFAKLLEYNSLDGHLKRG